MDQERRMQAWLAFHTASKRIAGRPPSSYEDKTIMHMLDGADFSAPVAAAVWAVEAFWGDPPKMPQLVPVEESDYAEYLQRKRSNALLSREQRKWFSSQWLYDPEGWERDNPPEDES